MKTITLALVVMLSGCTVADSYLLGKFDNNEYMLVTQIRTDSAKAIKSCDNAIASAASAEAIADKTQLLENYSEKLQHNDDVYNASKSLNEIAQGLVRQYQSGKSVSAMFCKLKFGSLQNSAITIQPIIGKRPR
jgi:hypothetical protein